MRLGREGYVLPICLSICFALLSELYTTTYDSKFDPETEDAGHHPCRLNQRVRLECEHSPIADYGICKGRVKVEAQDTIGYKLIPDPVAGDAEYKRGQDPKDHYWIYFKTLKGEEFLMELCMFNFNFAMTVVGVDMFTPHRPIYPPRALDHFAGHFITREMRHQYPTLHFEKERFSVMNNKALQGIVRNRDWNWGKLETGILCAIMERIAGHTMIDLEKELLVYWTMNNMLYMHDNLWYKDYLNYEKHYGVDRGVGIWLDPGEGEDQPDNDDRDTWNELYRWNRRQRKGKITAENLGQVIRKLKEEVKVKRELKEKERMRSRT